MENNESLSLETMREKRGTHGAIYIQFVNSRKYYTDYAFCFYEGEDGKYYDDRIRKKFNDKFIKYEVGNKKEVLKLLNKIRDADLYEDVCTMFFVDRDYDVSMAKKDEDLYETPCYSIENLYVQRDSFIKILKSEFGLNQIDEDFHKCLQDFEIRGNEFNNYILEFNALALLRRKKSDSNSNFSFSSVKTSHMVKVDVNFVTKAERYEETIENIKKNLEIKEFELEEVKKELLKNKELSLVFRGKNQMDFFVEFVMKLKELNRSGGYFKYKHNNIHINITSNRLSELSQYAITPPCLEKFISIHNNKFQKMKKLW